MTREQTAILLAAIQAFDNRNVEAVHVEAWHAILGRYELPVCQDAVVWHYTQTRDRIMPADVVRYIRRQDPHQGHVWDQG